MGFDFGSCAVPTPVGECEIAELFRPQNNETGPCCDEYKITTNSTCLCEAKLAAEDCPYESAIDYQTDKCPETDKWKVEETEADASLGRCCPSYKCVKTDQYKLRLMREKTPKTTRRS